MGLTVAAYTGLKKLDALFDVNGEPVDPVSRVKYTKYLLARVCPDFPQQALGIEHNSVYSFEACVIGWSHSYGSYSGWREALAAMAGYPRTTKEYSGYCWLEHFPHTAGAFEVHDGPFHELICFSDCEGCIGPIVSAKLALDFSQWGATAAACPDEFFYDKFVEWQRLFSLAANTGAVVFG